MKDNEIEKAATDSCVIDNNIFNPELIPYYEQGFKEGAKWRINSVWHKMNIEPMKNELIVLHGNGNTVTILWNGDMKWDGMDKFFKAEIWAYMSDLIPDTEE